jgi:hypothetical protein
LYGEVIAGFPGGKLDATTLRLTGIVWGVLLTPLAAMVIVPE